MGRDYLRFGRSPPLRISPRWGFWLLFDIFPGPAPWAIESRPVGAVLLNIWDHKEGGTSFRRRPDEPDYIAHYKLFQPSQATKWWEERKNKSLRDLQIEVLEWVLAEETKSPEAFSDVQRERVEKQLTALRKSKTPMKPGYPFSR
jgi:hypothetical protein